MPKKLNNSLSLQIFKMYFGTLDESVCIWDWCLTLWDIVPMKRHQERLPSHCQGFLLFRLCGWAVIQQYHQIHLSAPSFLCSTIVNRITWCSYELNLHRGPFKLLCASLVYQTHINLVGFGVRSRPSTTCGPFGGYDAVFEVLSDASVLSEVFLFFPAVVVGFNVILLWDLKKSLLCVYLSLLRLRQHS